MIVGFLYPPPLPPLRLRKSLWVEAELSPKENHYAAVGFASLNTHSKQPISLFPHTPGCTKYCWGKGPLLHLQYSWEVSLLLFFLMTLVHLRETLFIFLSWLWLRDTLTSMSALANGNQRFLAITSGRAPGDVIETLSNFSTVKGSSGGVQLHFCTLI